jgi:hypothetical protein
MPQSLPIFLAAAFQELRRSRVSPWATPKVHLDSRALPYSLEGATRSAAVVAPRSVAVWAWNRILKGVEAASLGPAAVPQVVALGAPGAGVSVFANFFDAGCTCARAPVGILVRDLDLLAGRFAPFVHGALRVADRDQGPTVVLRIAGVPIEVVVAIHLVGIINVGAVIIGVKESVAVVIRYGLTEIYTVVVLRVALTLAATLSAVVIFDLAVIYTDGRSRGDREDQREHERQKAY